MQGLYLRGGRRSPRSTYSDHFASFTRACRAYWRSSPTASADPELSTVSREFRRPAIFLGLSLFERLVHSSTGQDPFPFGIVQIQRQIHPPISALVRTAPYPQLENSVHVEGYPMVAGIKRRLFCLNHDQYEDGADQAVTISHSDQFEVEMVLALVTHLMRQSVYGGNGSPVLTPYLSQMLKIRRRMANPFEVTMTEGDLREIDWVGIRESDMSRNVRPAKKSLLKSLKISTVDNFQGEEAKVVIISLVRSSLKHECGFLKDFKPDQRTPPPYTTWNVHNWEYSYVRACSNVVRRVGSFEEKR